MELQEIISLFRSPKPNGNNSYMVTCPCHNDNTQSLCISEDNGKILLNCFAGCRAEDITRAIGLSMRDLFQSPPQGSKTPKPASIEYRYGDRLKKIRFYKWTNGKWQKSFCWQHKDNNGSWQKGRGGINPPLYNQEILSNTAADNTVYIVEGEKDANTMTDKLGLLAVSAPDGATKGNKGKKWDKRFNSLFTGVNVVIIPDNDEAGRNFASLVANELLTVAHSVKVLDLCTEWENLKEKGDITDIYENEQPSRNKTVAQTVKYKIEALKDCTKAITEPLTQAEDTETKAPENNIKYAPLWVYQDDYGKLKLDESQYIECFAEQQGVKCINGVLYSVNGKMSDDKAKNIIFNEIKGYIRTNASDKSKKLLEGIKQYCYTEPPTPTLDKIHFKNGTLSKDENGLFTVWSNEKEFCINRINADYNPNAKAPTKFFDYLKTVYYEDDQRTIQQYCGYCLLPTTILQKALLIIGDGGEGKSVLGAVLNGIFGESNCYNDSISVLQKNFGIANIENKLLFIDDDLSENALTNARTFKNLVTNKTTIAAEKKFIQDNQFKSYARFLIFGNFTLQSLYDISEGFSRRQLVLQAKPKDRNRIDNPFIDREIIETESEGVAKWLVDGLNELIKRSFKIYVSERTQEKSEELKKQQDSVLCFLEECDSFIIKPGLQIHSYTLYQFYQDFCDDNLLTTLKQKTFVSAVKAKGKKKGIEYSTNVNIRGKRARGFEGIGVDVEITH
ncbi:phage/plasmid primase, P4 family [Ruminococcus sp.]|uniref:phage/plasmid primase, P4 family n=1 Tax=Ruminococcus sp. TaxID=41978 RepID=UPI003AAB9639